MYTFAVFGLMTALLGVNAWHHEEHHHPRPYAFGYKVHDHHTGDHHQQHEESDGHVVKGSYSLKEADGTTRIVEYVADPHSGFNAVVKRVGHAQHPQHYGHHVHHGGLGQSSGGHGHAQSYVGTTHWGGHGQSSEDHHGHAESYVGTTHWGGYGHHGGLGQSSGGHHGHAQSYIGTTHWGFHF